jgi:hypothetical protein
MNITQDARENAAWPRCGARRLSPGRLCEKAEEFRKGGGEIYRKA